MRLTRISLSLLLAALVLAAPASAQNCIAPPGTGAVDEYCENVPDARGDEGGKGSGSSGSGGQVLPSTLAALAASGTDGEALVRALGEDPNAGQPPKSGRRDELQGPATRPSAPSSNPLDAVTQAVAQGATIDTGFVLAGLALLLAMLAWAWIAYRRRPA